MLWAWSDGSPHVLAKYDFTTRAVSVQATGSRLYVASQVIGPGRFIYPTAGPYGEFFGFGYTTSSLGKWVYVPLWFVLVVAAITFFVSLRLARRRGPIPGVCRSCGYDLRATPGRCPECGAVPAGHEQAAAVVGDELRKPSAD